MEDVKKLTANAAIEKVAPHGRKLTVVIKSWPAQSEGGLIMPDSFTVIRGEMYICEVLRVGETVDIVAPGDIVVVSMYSGHHVATSNGFLKVIEETDILTHKATSEMISNPETFKPGINYLLIKIQKNVPMQTESGIYMPVSNSIGSSNSKQDVATTSAEIIAKGAVNKYGEEYDNAEIGDTIIIDSYAGLDIPSFDVNGDVYYRVIYNNNVVATIEK